MKKSIMLFLCLWMLLLWVAESRAATLIWDAQPAGSGSIIVERGDSPTGPFSLVATLPEGTMQFILTPGAWGHYRPRHSAGAANSVLYSADIHSGFLADRVAVLEAKVAELETAQGPAPDATAPTGNFATRIIDPDHIEITGTNCLSMATTGSGTRRVIECRH